MTHVKNCTSCDGRDAKQHMNDAGECRECQGIERPERPSVSGYVSPDDVERAPDYYAQEAMESRNRVVNNQ